MAYVYGHYKADSGELFYIGKGIKRRAWDSSGRNRYWRRVVNKHGLEVRILHDNLTEREAYDKEKELIEQVGLDNLTNTRPGGTGMTSEEATAVMKRNWQNPEFRKKMTELNRTPNRTSAMGISAAKRNTELWQNEQWRTEQIEKRKHLTTPEHRDKCESALRDKWQEPEFKERMSKHRKNMWNNPEVRERLLRKEPCPVCGKIVPIRSMGSHNRKHASK